MEMGEITGIEIYSNFDIDVFLQDATNDFYFPLPQITADTITSITLLSYM